MQNHTKEDASMADHRTVAPDTDPVCGMTVDVKAAQAKGLTTVYLDHQYVFCGKGCFLEFRDDPETFLKPNYEPAM
jgi:YHS domain-containing protein